MLDQVLLLNHGHQLQMVAQVQMLLLVHGLQVEVLNHCHWSANEFVWVI